MVLPAEAFYHSKHGSKLEFLSPKLSTYRSNFCLASGARRLLASNKQRSCLPSCRPCFSHLDHPRDLVPGWLEVDGVSEVAADWWCHTLGYSLNGFPLNGISGDGIVFVAERIREKEKLVFKIQEEDLRCSHDCMSFLRKNLFFLDV